VVLQIIKSLIKLMGLIAVVYILLEMLLPSKYFENINGNRGKVSREITLNNGKALPCFNIRDVRNSNFISISFGSDFEKNARNRFGMSFVRFDLKKTRFGSDIVVIYYLFNT